MGKKRPPLTDLLESARPFMEGRLPFAAFIQQHGTLVRDLGRHDPLRVSRTVAGLLTLPELQSNCLRLEVLIHLAVSSCHGTREPTWKVADSWFHDLGLGWCKALETPAEDVFVSLIETPRGNFRLLEGIWEKNGFHLQRLMNVLEGLNEDEEIALLLDQAYALLAMSDRVCERARLVRYQSGNPAPVDALPSLSRADFTALEQIVTFSPEDLAAASIQLERLSPFVFDPESRADLANQELFSSELERFPVALEGRIVHLLLPTAISAAIRSYVIGRFQEAGLLDLLADRLAHEIALELHHIPLLGDMFHVPLRFNRASDGLLLARSKS